MKKDLYKKMSMFQGISSNVSLEVEEVKKVPEYIMPDSELDRVIREIFSVDERTGLPMGDLSYYLSPDGNPTVKQWLENNLLKPRASRGENPADLTDDMIAEFARGADESVDDYQARLMGYYDSALAEMNKSVDFETK